MVQEELQLFPNKTDSMAGFTAILKRYDISQRSILLKSYIFALAFNNDYFEFEQFLKQICSTYSYQRLTNNKLRQVAYLSSILFFEIRAIEESIRTDKIGLIAV